MPLLSVIIPVYNEAATVKQILEKIDCVNIDKEIILVNDSSTDGTDRVLRDIQLSNLKVIHHTTNQGKGAAFLTGLSQANGEYVIIQDADLEYEPGDYLKLIKKIKDEQLDMVLGARFLEKYQGLFMHRLGNRFLTSLINFLFRAKLNDYSTCYKLAKKTTWQKLKIASKGFEIEVEIICKMLKNRFSYKEVPVSYYPRTYRQGKKIRWIDGLWAILNIFKYRFCV